MDNPKNNVSKRKYQNLTQYRLLHATAKSPFYEEYVDIENDGVYQITVPRDWSITEDTTWKYYFPPLFDMPLQGWKIHISARPGEETVALLRTSELLVQLRVPFKHLVSKRSFMQASMKYANRSSSGKLVTVYPRDNEQFCSLLSQLDELTQDMEGPYILSDTKFGQGPVYFRYGGFYYRNRQNEDGSTVLAIESNDGTLVEDVRAPMFVLPEFVSVPEAVSRQVYSRLNPDTAELIDGLYPYSVQDSLHFSNGGGVYLASNTTDQTKAVLKEARPYAGYSTQQEDAVVRLRHERDVLQCLQNVASVPRYLGYKSIDGHEFLIESFMDGVSLQSWIASNYPFSQERDLIEEYSRDALAVANRIVSLVDEVHMQGIALMDISAKNIMVDEFLNVSLIDFEACRNLNESDAHVLGTPGFVPFVKCSNIERDIYAITNVLFYMFWPSWTSAFSPETLHTGLRSVDAFFPPEVHSFLSELLNKIPVRMLKPRFNYAPLDIETMTLSGLIQGLVLGVHGSQLKMESSARRYPGDATQFLHGRSGMLDIETGAAGVMLMLSRAGCNVEADVDWVVAQLNSSEPIGFHGLLRGVVGIASAFSQAGFEKEAINCLPAELPEVFSNDVSVRTGIAGTVLALCEIANTTGNQNADTLLRTAAGALKESIEGNVKLSSIGAETGNAVGLFDGWSGAALACRELSYYFNGDSEWEDLMHVCLQREIQDLTLNDKNTLYVDYSGINFGYLAEGTAGIAYALAVCAPQDYSTALTQLHPGLAEFIALNGGLFRGLGGKVAALLALDEKEDKANTSIMMRNLLETFLFADDGEKEAIYVLGDGGACLSTDYSTGAAGLIGLLLSIENGSCQWFPAPLH